MSAWVGPNVAWVRKRAAALTLAGWSAGMSKLPLNSWSCTVAPASGANANAKTYAMVLRAACMSRPSCLRRCDHGERTRTREVDIAHGANRDEAHISQRERF